MAECRHQVRRRKVCKSFKACEVLYRQSEQVRKPPNEALGYEEASRFFAKTFDVQSLARSEVLDAAG